MKLFLLLMATTSLSVFLSSCSPVYRTNNIFTPPTNSTGTQCTNQCLQQQSFCNMQCQQNFNICRSDANTAANFSYQSYLQQQAKNNQRITKKLNDFINYSSCNNNCGCDETYQQCYISCGGQVIPNKQCVSHCHKLKIL